MAPKIPTLMSRSITTLYPITRSCLTGDVLLPKDDEESLTTTVRAYVGAMIHSLGLSQGVEVLPRAMLVVDHGKGGLILSLDKVEESEESELVEVARARGAEVLVELGPGRFLIPGFVDTHAHAPQYAFTGTGMNLPLLQWLEKYTFPCESRFSDLAFAREVYSKSVHRHLMYGTTTCSYFATLHLEATKLLVDIVREQGQRAYVGKVSMDRNSPESYQESSTEQGVKDAHAFINYVLQHEENKGRKGREAEEVKERLPVCCRGSEEEETDEEEFSEEEEGDDALRTTPSITTALTTTTTATASSPPALVTPVITPRFVPTCTADMLKALGQLSDAFKLPVQSHLCESPGEIAWVRELHPECESYTDVYRTYGLLHERAYFAHCCHCGGDEREMLKTCGAGVSHCPSSNFMLGSGVLNVRRLLDTGVKVGLGTDVAGGYSTSMLDALRQAIIASRSISFTEKDSQGQPYAALSYKEAFHLATLGGAEVLGLEGKLGNFTPGKFFDGLMCTSRGEKTFEMFDGESLDEAFEKFLFLGDDRNIERVYVGGKRVR